MKYLAVKNFKNFQHYKDRRPPWIKFYGAVLDDYAFVQLSDAARSHLMLIWQVAATHDNRIPYDAKYIGLAIKAKGRVDLASLIAAGFLIEVTEDASDPIAECTQDASAPLANPEQSASENGARHHARGRSRARGEGEREAETETEQATSTTARDPGEWSPLALRLVSDLDREALGTLLSHAPNPLAFEAEIAASLNGMTGHVRLTPEQLGPALRDFVANGAAVHGNLRQLRRYLEQAARVFEPTPRSSSNGTHRPDADAHFIAEMERLQREPAHD